MLSSSPLFMFGFERSGTTLLSMMIGAHSDIAVPFSLTGLWFKYYKKQKHYNYLQAANDLENMVDDLLAEERIKLWDVVLDRQEVLNDLPLNNFAVIVERFHLLYARKVGKKYWANIDIANLDYIYIVNQWFPTAKFLHIVRDGRDVALSHESYPYGASNILDCAEKWRYKLNLNIMAGKILGPKRYMIVKYEDLVLNTDATLKKICEFAGVEYSVSMLNYPEMIKKKVPLDKQWLWPALDKPPQRSKVGRWKNNMSEHKRIVFERYAKDTLDELEYETYSIIPKRVFAFIYEAWCFFDRGGRIKRAFRPFKWISAGSVREQREGR